MADLLSPQFCQLAGHGYVAMSSMYIFVVYEVMGNLTLFLEYTHAWLAIRELVRTQGDGRERRVYGPDLQGSGRHAEDYEWTFDGGGHRNC